MVDIDIIILSYAKNDDLKKLTEQAIDTLLASEDPEKIKFDVLVIESNKALQPYQFANTITIYPAEEFGFNKYLNIGIKHTRNPYICLCNNDLKFHKGWATEILKAMAQYPEIDSANPYSDNFDYCHRIKNADNVIIKSKHFDVPGILTGWCIFTKREIFKKIGLLDERFTFWYADNDYGMTLKKHGLKHALVKSSLVTHIACQSHDLLLDKKEELTTGQQDIFKAKWQKWYLLKKKFNKLKSIFD